MSLYYIYFNKKVLDLNSFKIFRSFSIPVVIGILISIPLFLINFPINLIILKIIIKSIIWVILFLSALILLDEIKLKEIKDYF
jgi:hypothetical protein